MIPVSDISKVLIDTVMSSSCYITEARCIESENYSEWEIQHGVEESNPYFFYDPLSITVMNYVRQDRSFEEYSATFKGLYNYERFINGAIVRTRYIDEQIQKIIKKHDIKQMVIVGCGMDGRCFRLNSLTNVDVFELDQHQVIQTKQMFLKSSKALELSIHLMSRSLQFVECNLTDHHQNSESWSSQLLKAGYKTNVASLWLLEGVLMYLNQDVVTQLWKDIFSMTANDSYIIQLCLNRANYEHAKTSQHPLHKTWLSYLPDDYSQVLNDCGWSVEEICCIGQTDEINVNWQRMEPKPCICTHDNKLGRLVIRNDFTASILSVLQRKRL